MSLTSYKICPECQSRAALTAPHCLTCRRKYNTRFVPNRAFQTLRLPFTAVITPPTKRDMTAALQIFGVLLLALGVLCASLARSAKNEPTGFLHAGGDLWSGERLYFSTGPEQTPIPLFVVLGGCEKYTAPNGQTFRAVKVRTIGSGEETWKPREAFAHSAAYFVKKDDPALVCKTWRDLSP